MWGCQRGAVYCSRKRPTSWLCSSLVWGRRGRAGTSAYNTRQQVHSDQKLQAVGATLPVALVADVALRWCTSTGGPPTLHANPAQGVQPRLAAPAAPASAGRCHATGRLPPHATPPGSRPLLRSRRTGRPGLPAPHPAPAAERMKPWLLLIHACRRSRRVGCAAVGAGTSAGDLHGLDNTLR